ncbi:MAG: hypothetical protein LC721_03250 [Actinobacteria bacterium]|nr:hypothetical protein [Actinomycetota bacterium]
MGATGLAVFHRVDDQLRAASGRLIVHRPRRLARRAWRSPAWTPSCPSDRRPHAALPATISTIAELPSPTEASAVNQPARRPPDAYHRTDRPETKMTGGDAATTDALLPRPSCRDVVPLGG